jgi:phenylacetate-CoA ligase
MFIGDLRKWLYLRVYDLRGENVGRWYRKYQKEDAEGIPPFTTRNYLLDLLKHCHANIPYYRSIMNDLGDWYKEDPFEYLKQMPILSKEIIRTRFDDLKSSDLSKRKWYLNASSGSTGEPVEFIQDKEYVSRMSPITMLFSKLAGREVGESQVLFWGSMHDIQGAQDSWKAKAIMRLSNTTLRSVYRLDPATIRSFIEEINRKPPKLIVGYNNSLNEIAKFAEREGIKVRKQNAVIGSAGMMFPDFRLTIERVFQCRVYNRYGSREVGDIACERPGFHGLWVPPWGNYLEIVDPENKPVPNEVEGEIVVTNLVNYAMPLIRYQIEDRGVLASPAGRKHPKVGQVLERVIGRSVETYVNVRGETVDPSHFMPMLYHINWIRKYQIILNCPTCVTFRMVKDPGQPPQADVDNIVKMTRGIMNDPDCDVQFEFVEDIQPTRSGKLRFIINEIKPS